MTVVEPLDAPRTHVYKSTRLAVASLLMSLVMFGISLTQDAFYIDRPGNPGAWAPAWGVLLLGWLSITQGGSAWLANLAVGWVWVFMSFRARRITALVVATAGLALALSFLLQTDIMTNAAGGTSKITGYGPAYWLWISSISVATLGCLTCVIIDRYEPVATTARAARK